MGKKWFWNFPIDLLLFWSQFPSNLKGSYSEQMNLKLIYKRTYFY